MASTSCSQASTAGGQPAAARTGGPASPRVPSRLRLSFFMMLGVYPIITTLLYLVLPLTAGWPIWQITMVVVPLMVPMIVFGLTPFIQKTFGRFILVPARR
ncbi:hypothetical protein [Pelagibacterium xiamenense]|uniref:hypothetical protein n=1 Tax=Pelagibacterium xiamenense TaxID=2901140 RepID=UPI001E44BBE3|nr:hypothetical protein [Pelagibacterium xiamenense]MCD7061254.1 hypothetical protein [Pelagibacterium xiamenense]